jgi:hypothetical protein
LGLADTGGVGGVAGDDSGDLIFGNVAY